MDKTEIIEGFKPGLLESTHVQIAVYLRDLITKGLLQPGTKLPTTAELSAAWNTHPPAVSLAMKTLVREGLVTRLMRRGTFVRDTGERLRKVALYVPGDRCRENNFIGYLMHSLEAELALRGVRTDRWMNHWTDQPAGQPWEAFVQAAQRREFQGVIIPAVDPREVSWLAQLPVPTMALGLEPLPHRAWIRMGEALDQAMRSLAQHGCRRVGLITVHAKPKPTAGRVKSGAAELHDNFRKSAAHHGLVVQDRWILSPPKRDVSEKGAAEFGFESFHRLWRESHRPEALVVHTDVAAQGVLLAMAQRQVQVPSQLRLVLHRNVEMGLFCTVPAGWIDVSVNQAARTLVEGLTNLQKGQSAPQMIGFSATFSETTGAGKSATGARDSQCGQPLSDPLDA